MQDVFKTWQTMLMKLCMQNHCLTKTTMNIGLRAKRVFSRGLVIEAEGDLDTSSSNKQQIICDFRSDFNANRIIKKLLAICSYLDMNTLYQ